MGSQTVGRSGGLFSGYGKGRLSWSKRTLGLLTGLMCSETLEFVYFQSDEHSNATFDAAFDYPTRVVFFQSGES